MNWIWIFNLITQWVLIILAFTVGYIWPELWPLVWLFIGTRQAALAVLGHDGSHWHIVPSREKTNDILAALAFWPLTITLAGWRRFHLAHHAYQGTAKDPELAIQLRYKKHWAPKNKIIQVLLDLCGAGFIEICDLHGVMLRNHVKQSVPMLLTIATISGLLIIFGYWIPVLIWFLSLVTVLFALTRLRGWEEHFEELNYKVQWRPEPPFWIRWTYLPMGIWSHIEHHRWPALWAKDQRKRNYKEELK